MIEEQNQENILNNIEKDVKTNEKINSGFNMEKLEKLPLKKKNIDNDSETKKYLIQENDFSESSDYYLSENNINKEELDIYKNIENKDEIKRKSTIKSQNYKKSFSSSGNITDNTFPITSNSKVFIDPFDSIEIDNNKIKIENNDDIFPKTKKILFFLEIIIGFCSISLAIYILFIISKDTLVEQKKLAPMVELLIIIISFIGIYPYKNYLFKKIVVLLYIWEGIILIPLSILIGTGIIDSYIYDKYFEVIVIKIIVLVIQIIIFIISLVLKVNI